MAYGDAPSPYPALPNLPPNPDVTQQVVAGDAAAPAEDMKAPPNYLVNSAPTTPPTAPAAPVAQSAAQPPAQKADPFAGVASAPSAAAQKADPFDGVASAPAPLTPAESYRNEHPILQTVGRAGRDLAIGAGGLADVGLLPLKEAALGAGLATGNKTLQKVGTNPTVASQVESGIDSATGGVLKPTNGLDKATDFAAQMMVPGGTAERAGQEAVAHAPGIFDAAKTALNPMQAGADAVKAKIPVPERIGPAPKPTDITPDQQRAGAGKIFKAVEKSGGAIAPSEVDNWLSHISDMAEENDHGSYISALGSKNVAQALIEKLTKTGTETSPNVFRTMPITPQSALKTDQEIGNLITPSMYYPNGKMTAEGAQLLAIKNSFLDMVENAMNDPSKIQGGPEGFRAIQDAKDQWSQALGAQQVRQIIERGSTAVGSPATSIANGFRTLLNNPNRMRYFKNQPDVVAAIKYAAKTGVVTGMLKTMGSRLNAIVAGGVGAGIGYHIGGAPGSLAGEIIGNAAGYAASAPARAAATKLQTNRGEAVIDAIRSKNLPPDIGTAASAVTPTVGANVAARGTQTDPVESDAHAYARAAIAAGAPRDAVIQRLNEQGYGPGGL